MQVFVAGGSGKTGSLLVQQLLERGHRVVTVVRSRQRFAERIGDRDSSGLTVVQASILELNETMLAEHLAGCSAVARCLGHHLTLRGMFGPPRRLVTDATRKLCQAAQATSAPEPLRLVLMNTAGNRDRAGNERVSLAERGVLGILRTLVPPHADNEQAADYLRSQCGQDHPRVAWVVVRPDSLIDREQVTEYDVFPSPTRSAIFNPGKTSRVNVAHFMAELLSSQETWQRWRGRMPVIYNRD